MGINTDDYEVDFTISVTDEGNILVERFISQFSYKTIVKAYRKKKYNAALLYLDYRIRDRITEGAKGKVDPYLMENVMKEMKEIYKSAK